MAPERKDPLERTLRPWSEARRLRDELRMTQARLAAVEEERADMLRRDKRAGVLTRDAFRESAAAALRINHRAGRRAALMLVDIDGFRALNGRRGAAAGDEALAAVGSRLRELVRAGDVVGRTGADELAVVMPDCGLDGARGVAERLVALLEADGRVTISAGVSVDGGAAELDGLLADAAEVLEKARRAGGGRVGTLGRETPTDPSRGAIGALALTLAERDAAMGEHAERVVTLASAVARRLGLDGEEIERIAAAALLHEVGKVALPDTILQKAGPLDDAEWDAMRRYPLVGERILRAVPGLGPVARMVRHVHERGDGTGYPDRLRTDEIPLGSRIVLACNAYDAMTSGGPHREPMAHAGAIHELHTNAGTQFDARVVEALISYLQDRAPAVPQAAAA